jgi:hypothetical protein
MQKVWISRSDLLRADIEKEQEKYIPPQPWWQRQGFSSQAEYEAYLRKQGFLSQEERQAQTVPEEQPKFIPQTSWGTLEKTAPNWYQGMNQAITGALQPRSEAEGIALLGLMGLPFGGGGGLAGTFGMPAASELWGTARALPLWQQIGAKMGLAAPAALEQATALPFKGLGALGKLAGKSVGKFVPKETETIAPKTVNPAMEKLKGALDYALKTQRETAQLYKSQLGQKAAKLEAAQSELKGIETYYKQFKALRGKLSQAKFKMPPQFQLTAGEAKNFLNDIFAKPRIALDAFDKEHASTGLMKLAGLLKDSETGLPQQLIKSEIEILNTAFPELRPIISANTSMGTKAWATFIDAMNMPRAFLASGDFSVTFRQLARALARKPQHLPGVISAQARVVFSPKNYKMIMGMLEADPDIQLFMRSTLDHPLYWAPEPGQAVPRLWTREETFQSNLIEKIPVIRSFVNASERAFVGGANYMRGMMAKDYAQMLGKMNVLYSDTAQLTGKTPEELTNIATKMGIKNIGTLKPQQLIDQIIVASDKNIDGLSQLIGVVTGRGDFPRAIRNLAPVCNAFLFAPRWVISQLELPALIASKNPIVRKEAARTLVQFLGAGASILSLASLAGYKVEMNSNSSNLGKIKVGNTYIDIWSGYAQWIRFLSQLATNKRLTTGTQEEQELNRLQTIWRFLQSKGSPIFSLLVDLLSGQNYMGEQLFTGGWQTARRELRQRLTPLTAQDILEGIEANGSVWGALAGVPSIAGIGIVSYKPSVSGGDRANPFRQTQTSGGKRKNPFK